MKLFGHKACSFVLNRWHSSTRDLHNAWRALTFTGNKLTHKLSVYIFVRGNPHSLHDDKCSQASHVFLFVCFVCFVFCALPPQRRAKPVKTWQSANNSKVSIASFPDLRFRHYLIISSIQIQRKNAWRLIMCDDIRYTSGIASCG